MKYELNPIDSSIESDRIMWKCPCGMPFDLEFRIQPKGIWYPLEDIADSATGGVTVQCTVCLGSSFCRRWQ